MTSVGRHPTLYELLEALRAITSVEADASALDPQAETFRVVLTFQRAQCPQDWQDGAPKPTWLFDQIVEELSAWLLQRNKEEQWVSKESQHGSSINTLMAHYHEELKKASATVPENMLTRSLKRTLSDTIVRLNELKERRAAGGVYSATENRRDKARKAWMDDEFETPLREEEQRKQHARGNSRDYGFGDFSSTGFAGIDPEDLEERWKAFDDIFSGGFGYDRAQQQKDPQKPQSGNRRTWFSVLGVSARASKKEITKAYRKLAARYHPDRYKEADAHAKMAEINTARDEGLGGV